MKKVLVIAAHPDDEVLGCGGTIANLVELGNTVYVLILGEGVTSRDSRRKKKESGKLIKKLRSEARQANKILGVKKVLFANFPDNCFDTVSLLKLTKTVEEVKNKIMPDIIFTHFKNDLNIDHYLTYRAVITATRPLPEESVKEIYSFEILSSTEWNYPLTFSPNIFFNISKTMKLKIKALKEYRSEVRDYPHPRSPKGVTLTGQYWGLKTGIKFAEAFECVRKIQ